MLLGLSITVFAGWFALALLIAVGIGRAVRIAEEREEISPALPVSHFVAEAEDERSAALSQVLADMTAPAPTATVSDITSRAGRSPRNHATV